MINVRIPLIVTVALALGACAQTPLKDSPTLAAQATHYGVSPDLLVRAESAGYSPETRSGKTYFCTEKGQSFSYVPRRLCLDKTQMNTWLNTAASSVSDLHHHIYTLPPIVNHGAPSGPGG